MTDAAPYGWSGLNQVGNRVFVKGAPLAETALTSIATYAVQADFEGAQAADRLASLTFPQVQAAQANLLNLACAVAITGGYTSSALGAPHLYGSKATDQANLDADMMAAAGNSGITAEIACSADGGTTWTAAEHTAVQIAALWGDFRAWRIAQQTKNRAFQAQVAAATTVEAVQAIVWS